MAVYTIDALTDERWDEFLQRDNRAGVFHSSGWLRALLQTYGYKPLVFTTSQPGEQLENGLAFCEVDSWITGRRLVSLPFSDHCDPLVGSLTEAGEFAAHLNKVVVDGKYKYLEFRPDSTASLIENCAEMTCSQCFLQHRILLDIPLADLYQKFHRDCIRRKIRRAERESLEYVKGRSDLLLQQFYRLLLRTCRRHSQPPQPLQWFRNLSTCLGDRLAIHVAYKGDQPVAAFITLDFKKTVTYKYGCSDERFSRLGGTPFLFWKIIQESKNAGALQLDLGRTNAEDKGLVKFKDRLGAECRTLRYYRLSGASNIQSIRESRVASLLQRSFTHIPDFALVASGKFLYRHIG